MKYIVPLAAILLGGCVHGLPKTAAPPQHHVAKPAPKPVAKPAIVDPQAETPKQTTFKRKWLRLFFRDRATR